MHQANLNGLHHDHTFSQDKVKPGEKRMVIVILITAIMMIVEIAAGIYFGSMALLADGLHMGSHAVALGISAFAYRYARKHAHNKEFNFGTGKVDSLGGFTGAILLAVFALMMAWESVHRLLDPHEISFNETIGVAVLGLVVNVICFFILGHENHDHHHHDNQHDETEVTYGKEEKQTEKDHNLKAAYLHVLADALTSVLAIAALLAGKYYGMNWMDPTMGIIGALLISKWSLGLVYSTSDVLLDKQAPKPLYDEVTRVIQEQPGCEVTDLHIWSIGTSMYAAELALVTKDPKSPEFYKKLIPSKLGVVHMIVEVHPFEEIASGKSDLASQSDE